MAAYRHVRNLTDVEAAYVAGLIDGEGTITLGRRHRNERRQLVVNIANTERCLLDFVLERVGAGKITAKMTVDPRHTPSWVYCVSNRQALTVLKQLIPHLRSYKSGRAQVLLDRYRTAVPRNGKYNAARETLRQEMEDAFFSIGPAQTQRLDSPRARTPKRS